jgi:hypothetical protein
MKSLLSESNYFISRFFVPLPNNGYQTEGLMSIERRWEDAKIAADVALDILEEKAHEWCDQEFVIPVLIQLSNLRKQIKEDGR